jgi:hypothetical protein
VHSSKVAQTVVVRRGRDRVKLWKLLSIPAAILAAALFATPALANKATFSDIKITCAEAGHVCVDAKVSTAEFPEGGTRHVIVTLKGIKQGEDEFKVLATSQPQAVKDTDTTFHFCFDKVTTTDIEKFKVEIKKSGDEDLVVKEGVSMEQRNDCPVVAETTSPAQTVASASAARTAVLASTGGFDFRFPLIAAALLVVGVSLLLVSVSRGRSANK